ncbi:MAG TPA: hypothetical protein VFN35_24325, partial [Ktedonobacteraceae bacterium]|nr:hypothetical protein [Ktedonobacteraceae bacterium]
QGYVIPYATSLSAARIFQRCYWIDGLGNGRALPPIPDDRPLLEEGISTRKRAGKKTALSPSSLPPELQYPAMIAQQLARIDRPITFYSFVLNGKGSRRRSLNKAAHSAQNGSHPEPLPALPREGGLLSGNWPELAPALLTTLEQYAAIFLLNPLKDGLFRYPDLSPLYQRTAPTELFLWLSHKQIETRLLPALRSGSEAAALTNLLRNDRWKGLLSKTEGEASAEPFVNGLIDLFAESIKPHFLSVQRLTLPVHTRPALVEEAPYSLLFATRRQDSLCSLNDAVCRRGQRLLAESQQGVLNEAWFVAQREEQAVTQQKALYQEALERGRAARIRRWPDLRQQLLLAHFGQFTQIEYDQLILTLLERGEVRCEWRKRNGEANEVSIPGNDDLLLWR